MKIYRNVLIVDDSKNIGMDLKQYNSIFKKMKNDTDINDIDYELIFYHEEIYGEAINLLKSTKVFDVLLIDYDLSSAGNSKDGKDLVTEIRTSINKHCKIIFYTMGELSTVFPDRQKLIDLFNQGIYKFLSKDLRTNSQKIYGSKTHQLRVEAIIEAIENIDYVQLALEKYFIKFEAIIQDEKILIDGKQFEIKEIIDSIKRDDDTGRKYKRNLAESLIIQNMLEGDD